MNSCGGAPYPLRRDRPLAQDLSGGPLVSALSNELVHLYRKHYGRGPTQTRTVILDDMIVCRMSDPFTPAEQTLIGLGRFDEVSRLRALVQDQLREEFARTIERLTDRSVVAHVSGVHAEPDLCVNVFMLAPGGE